MNYNTVYVGMDVREFDSYISQKIVAGRIKPAFLCQIFGFYVCYFMLLCGNCSELT